MRKLPPMERACPRPGARCPRRVTWPADSERVSGVWADPGPAALRGGVAAPALSCDVHAPPAAAVASGELPPSRRLPPRACRRRGPWPAWAVAQVLQVFCAAAHEQGRPIVRKVVRCLGLL